MSTLGGAVATLSTPLAVGTHSLRTTFNSDNEHSSSGTQPPNLSYTVLPAPQTITFGGLQDKLTTDADFSVSATASSLLSVMFQSTTSAVCSLTDATVHLIGVGTCGIRASQAGDAAYASATAVDQSFAVRQQTQTITFGSLADTPFGAPPVLLQCELNLVAGGQFCVDHPERVHNDRPQRRNSEPGRRGHLHGRCAAERQRRLCGSGSNRTKLQRRRGANNRNCDARVRRTDRHHRPDRHVCPSISCFGSGCRRHVCTGTGTGSASRTRRACCGQQRTGGYRRRRPIEWFDQPGRG